MTAVTEGPVIAVITRRSAGPAMRTAMTAATGTAPETTSAQTGERLGDGFGGIVRFGGHEFILHAT